MTDTMQLLHYYNRYGAEETLSNIPGAYLVAIAKKGGSHVTVMRDRTGLRPGWLGFRGERHFISSEDAPLRDNNIEVVRELHPGGIYRIRAQGLPEYTQVVEEEARHCFFELIYMMQRGSRYRGVNAAAMRRELGKQIAAEFKPPGIDFVTYVPASPEPAARAYYENTDVDFRDLFYKKHGTRSFLGPDDEERRTTNNNTLFMYPQYHGALAGMTAVVFDDSIVRGNTLHRARHLLYDIGGIRKAYFVSAIPPVGVVSEDGTKHGCVSGIDMPPDADNFFARHRTQNRSRTPEERNEAAQMEVIYPSETAFFTAFERQGLSAEDLCTFCIGGERPYQPLAQISVGTSSASGNHL